MHISRAGWEKGLSLSTLTHPEPSVFPNTSAWETEFANFPVHIQWDTERSLRGAGLNHFSIQVGIGRQMIQEYVDQRIVKIEDFTSTVSKIRDLLKSGDEKNTKRHLPSERLYPIEPRIGNRILIQQKSRTKPCTRSNRKSGRAMVAFPLVPGDGCRKSKLRCVTNVLPRFT